MKLTDIVDELQELPTLPTVVARINEEMNRESLTAKSLGTIIAEDTSLTAKLLKLANSAYYGLVREVDSIDRAITVLGLHTVRSLALSISLAKFFKEKTEIFDLRELWHHSLGTAIAAKNIIFISSPNLAEQAFISGLLHDLGKIALILNNPNEMAQIIRLMRETEKRQSVLEKEIIGFHHARVGAALAHRWNFPTAYVNAIKYHHSPSDLKTDNLDERKLVIAVHIGNKAAKIKQIGSSTDPRSDYIETKYFKLLNIPKEELPHLFQAIWKDYGTIMEDWDFD